MYLCLIDWQTDEKGTVLDGEPVKTSTISARLGCNERTARRGLERLQSEGYLHRVLREGGWQVTITKPKKRFRGRTDLSDEPDKNVQEVGQKCPEVRTEMSSERTKVSDPRTDLSADLYLYLPPKEGRTTKEPPKDAREVDEVWSALQKEHPRGHNPHPDLACQLFNSRCDTADEAQEILRQHREKWQPAWRAGRRVPDLDNWLLKFDPKADVGGQQPQAVSYADMIKEMEAEDGK